MRTRELRRKRSGNGVRKLAYSLAEATKVEATTPFLYQPIIDPQTVTLDSAKQAARVAAIETEIKLLADASLAWPVKGVQQWRGEAMRERAPFAVVKRGRAARFRLPRPLKAELIDRFCADADPGSSTPTTLIVVAHQDDESIGAGARLCKLTDAYVVHVTDGAPRDISVARRFGFATRDAYAEARHAEMMDALAVAGVAAERVIALGFVDGEASLRLVELCLRMTDLIDAIRPELILTHPYEGGHTDHDATAFAVHMACGLLRREGLRPPAVLELASYNSLNGERTVQEFLPHERADRDQRLILLADEEQELKQRMFDCFVTQQSVVTSFSTAFEKFRPAPRYVFTRPPHGGQLNYERYGNPRRGELWRKQAEVALRTLRIRSGR